MILGPRQQRGPTAPRKVKISRGHTYFGGTAFERSGNADPVGGGRAYSVGLSFEKQNALLAPSAAGKKSTGNADVVGLRMRATAVKVSIVHLLRGRVYRICRLALASH